MTKRNSLDVDVAGRDDYYRAMAEKVRLQTRVTQMRLEKELGELVSMKKLNSLKALTVQLLREIQRNYVGDDWLRNRIEDFQTSWERIMGEDDKNQYKV